MKKIVSRILTCGLGLMMVASLLVCGNTNTQVKAADNYFTANASTSNQDVEDVINGVKLNGSGKKYDGIEFSAGTYGYNLTNMVNPQRDFVVKTDSGANVTIDQGFRLSGSTDMQTTSFIGDGTFNVNGSMWGLVAVTNSTFNIKGTVNTTGTTGYGVYLMNWSGSPTNLTVDGGVLNVTGCATSNNEGGLCCSGIVNVINGGKINASGNGSVSFGDFYVCGTLNVNGNGSKVTCNATTNVSYGLVLAGTGTVCNITNNGKIEVNDTTGERGINAAGGTVINLNTNGNLTVNSTAANTSGIRRSTININNASLSVTGFVNGLDGIVLNSGDNALVTVNSVTKDSAITTGTGTDSKEVITGGSNKLVGTNSVVNGALVTSTSKLLNNPVNASGETLTRFDLNGFANTTINVGAGTTTPAYAYKVGNNHAPTSYVWAPAVKITYWNTKADYLANNTANIMKTNYTIRGNSVTYVGGSDAVAPTGYHFEYADTATKYTAGDALFADRDVYLVKDSVVTTTEYNISTSVENGTITPSTKVQSGKDITIKYSPNNGYVLDSVTVDGNKVDINKYPTSYTFKNVTSGHSIKVVYIKRNVNGIYNNGDANGNSLVNTGDLTNLGLLFGLLLIATYGLIKSRKAIK